MYGSSSPSSLGLDAPAQTEEGDDTEEQQDDNKPENVHVHNTLVHGNFVE